MALGDSFLQAAIQQYQPLDVQGALTGAQKIQSNDNALASQKLALAAETEESPLKTALFKEQAKSSLLSNAIATATDADTWDSHMRDIAKQFPEASQYIGRYSPVLQSRLASVYGGQSEAANVAGGAEPSTGGSAKGAVTPPTAAFDNQFAQTTPEQRAENLQKLSALSSALEGVGDETSWETMRQKMHAAGIPIMDQLGGYSPIKAVSLYKKIQPILSYLQGRVATDAAGIPAAKAAPDIRVVGNSLFAVDPYAGTAREIASTGRYASGGTDLMGNPVIFNQNTGQRAGAGTEGGGFSFDDFAGRMVKAENTTGDRTAKNPLSSATGDGQFTDKTWLGTIKAARPELAENMSDKQLLQLRKDPAFAREMTAENAKANAGILEQNGEHVNATSLALAHRFGAQGAVNVLKAAPDTPLSSILSADAIKANPGLEKQTAGDYVKDLSKRVGLDTIGQAQGTIDIPPEAHGDEVLKALPAPMANQVKALAEGRMAFPSGFALKSPYWQNMVRMVSQYDPDFDTVNYNGRAKTRADFAPGGAVGKNITALNRVLGHAGNVLLPAFEKLDNGQFPTWNQAANYIGEKLGMEAPTNARQAVDAVASEARKVFAASGGGSLTELQEWQKNFPINGSPAQQIGAMKQFADLLDSQIETLNDQWTKNMGKSSKTSVRDFMSPAAKSSLEKLHALSPNEGYKPSAAAPGWTVQRVGGK